MLAKVHVAKKQLGMTDEGYRAMLYGLFEVDSAGNNDRVCGHTRPDWIEITDSMPHAPVKRQILVIWKKLGYSMGSLDTRVKRRSAFRCLCGCRILVNFRRCFPTCNVGKRRSTKRPARDFGSGTSECGA